MSAKEQPQLALLLRLAELAARVYDLGILPLAAIAQDLFTRAELVILLRAQAERAVRSVESLLAGRRAAAQR